MARSDSKRFEEDSPQIECFICVLRKPVIGVSNISFSSTLLAYGVAILQLHELSKAYVFVDPIVICCDAFAIDGSLQSFSNLLYDRHVCRAQYFSRAFGYGFRKLFNWPSPAWHRDKQK